MATSSEPSPGSFKCALIQLNPEPLNPEYNFTQASNYIREAAARGAALSVLPEYHLSGWVPESPKFVEIAQTAHRHISKYQDLIRELKINIVPGSIVIVDRNALPLAGANNASDNKFPPLLNIAHFISQTGEILGSYTKANLWIPERTVLTSGPE